MLLLVLVPANSCVRRCQHLACTTPHLQRRLAMDAAQPSMVCWRMRSCCCRSPCAGAPKAAGAAPAPASSSSGSSDGRSAVPAAQPGAWGCGVRPFTLLCPPGAASGPGRRNPGAADALTGLLWAVRPAGSAPGCAGQPSAPGSSSSQPIDGPPASQHARAGGDWCWGEGVARSCALPGSILAVMVGSMRGRNRAEATPCESGGLVSAGHHAAASLQLKKQTQTAGRQCNVAGASACSAWPAATVSGRHAVLPNARHVFLAVHQQPQASQPAAHHRQCCTLPRARMHAMHARNACSQATPTRPRPSAYSSPLSGSGPTSGASPARAATNACSSGGA